VCRKTNSAKSAVLRSKAQFKPSEGVLESRHVKEVLMGLAEDLKALQELRDKGELSESAYAAARDAAIGKHAPPSDTVKPLLSWQVRVGLLVLLLFVGWYYLRVNHGTKQAENAIRTAVKAPITLSDSVENIPAASWKAVALNLPYAGTVNINLEVVNGNPIDVVVITPDQLEVLKQGGWGKMRVYTDFNAVKTKTYRRAGQLGEGNYYLLIRDTSLGILSARASDVSVKTILTP
jgi:hypothetical protein